jgi:hypothetical protein
MTARITGAAHEARRRYFQKRIRPTHSDSIKAKKLRGSDPASERPTKPSRPAEHNGKNASMARRKEIPIAPRKRIEPLIAHMQPSPKGGRPRISDQQPSTASSTSRAPASPGKIRRWS